MPGQILRIAAALVLILFSIGWLTPLYFGWHLQAEWLESYQEGRVDAETATFPEAARVLGNVAAYWFLLALLFWIVYAARKLVPYSE